jgi:hypothetical protein
VIDLRTIVPVDIETIEASVKKTGRCRRLHEATRTAGFGAELSALVQERCFYHLEAPVQRVTGYDTPYPHSLEWAYFPRAGAARPRAQEGFGGLMARYEFKLPDIGEGIAEAEIVAWHVKVGDEVKEDQQLADMMTDKATVEMEVSRRRPRGRGRGRSRRPDRDRLGAGRVRDGGAAAGAWSRRPPRPRDRTQRDARGNRRGHVDGGSRSPARRRNRRRAAAPRRASPRHARKPPAAAREKPKSSIPRRAPARRDLGIDLPR